MQQTPTSLPTETAAAAPATRFTTLNALLLALLAIGASLRFVTDENGTLWTSAPTTDAAGAKIAALALFAALLWGATAVASRLGQSLIQLLAALFAGGAVAGTQSLDTGGTLIATTAVLAAITAAASLYAAWRSHPAFGG